MPRSAARLAVMLLIADAVLAGLLLLYPVRNGITRPAILVASAALYLLLLLRLWRHRYPRLTLIAFAAILAAAPLLPGRPHDSAALRSAYLSALRKYEGTRYVWGGETRIGVDCSGLVRAAMVDALFEESLRTANPALLRECLWLWWHDIAARDMPAGYDGRMITLAHVKALRNTDPATLQPGDLAITADGAHVRAFLGSERWIEADPNSLRVLILPRNASSPWLDIPMTIVRWQCLQNSATP